jgi:hypothetical protein
LQVRLFRKPVAECLEPFAHERHCGVQPLAKPV